MVGLLLWVRFLDEGFGFLPAGALEPIRDDLGLNYTVASGLLVAPFVGSFPALWFTARADRGNPKPVVVGGAFAAALALGCFAVAPGPVLLLAGAAGWGFGGSLLVHGSEVVLARTSGARLHRDLRRVNLLGTAGDVLGPVLLMGVLAAGWSWRIAFGIAASGCAAYAMVLARTPLDPLAPSTEVDDARPAWRDRGAWRLGLLAVLLMPFDETWLAFAIVLLQTERGVAPSLAAGFGVVAVLGAFVGFGPLGRWSERTPDRRVIVIGAIALGVSAPAFGIAPVWVGFAIGFVVNAFISAVWVTLQHAALTRNPDAPGRTMALVVAVEESTIVVPLGLGMLADRQGLGAVFAVYGLLALMLGLVGATGQTRG